MKKTNEVARLVRQIRGMRADQRVAFLRTLPPRQVVAIKQYIATRATGATGHRSPGSASKPTTAGPSGANSAAGVMTTANTPKPAPATAAVRNDPPGMRPMAPTAPLSLRMSHDEDGTPRMDLSDWYRGAPAQASSAVASPSNVYSGNHIPNVRALRQALNMWNKTSSARRETLLPGIKEAAEKLGAKELPWVSNFLNAHGGDDR